MKSVKKRTAEAFFNSPEVHALKLQLCDMGRRLWSRAHVDGNGGNMAIRVGENPALSSLTSRFCRPARSDQNCPSKRTWN